MKANGSLISLQDWNLRGSVRPEMLKPPWWTASLLLQRMVDELPESRTLSASVKVENRTENPAIVVTAIMGLISSLNANGATGFLIS